MSESHPIWLLITSTSLQIKCQKRLNKIILKNNRHMKKITCGDDRNDI